MIGFAEPRLATIIPNSALRSLTPNPRPLLPPRHIPVPRSCALVHNAAMTTERIPPVDREALPPLFRDRSFWGMAVTQFLGAFNDNLFKQLILLIAVAGLDMQGIAMVVFALPFILFSGLAGFLSDRFSKRPIIVLSKIGEIVIMGLGVIGFAFYGATGLTGLLIVLFLMGMQSSFFGPGKYGILPEMLRTRDLPRANGFILMTTFVAIILGTAIAGLLKSVLTGGEQVEADSVSQLSMASCVCVLIAIVGTCTSLLVRRVPPAKPDMRFHASALGIPPEMIRLLRSDRVLLVALLASCMFWLAATTVLQAVNALGMKQLQLGEFEDFWTSVLTSVTSIGIAIGAIAAGKLSKGRVDFRIVRIGAWGMFGGLILLALPGPGADRHLLGFGGSIPLLILLGAFAGMYAIPIQVFIQARPPDHLKGRMIALMNQANFVAILLSGVVYFVFALVVNSAGLPQCVSFGFTALLMLPVAIFYHPPNEQLSE